MPGAAGVVTTSAVPLGSAPAGLAALRVRARAEAARLQQEVARLDLKVETLAEAYAATQARLDGLIQAAHRHQEALERSEQALQATRAAYAGDVRDLYARGPLVPLELSGWTPSARPATPGRPAPDRDRGGS